MLSLQHKYDDSKVVCFHYGSTMLNRRHQHIVCGILESFESRKTSPDEPHGVLHLWISAVMVHS